MAEPAMQSENIGTESAEPDKRRKGVFRKGNPGKPKGAIAHTTREIRELCVLLLDQKWVESARRRILAGLAPHLEKYLLEMHYGKPRETIDVSVTAAQMVQVVLPHNYREALPEEKPAIEAVATEITDENEMVKRDSQ